jgi:3-methyladenine DNA glycosylase Tag
MAASTRQLCRDLEMPYHEQNLCAALRDVHAAFRRISLEARQ